MKRTVFGAFIIAIGMAMLITGTALFTVSAQNGGDTDAEYGDTEQENRVYLGEYYKNGDKKLDKVTVSDSEITFADGTTAKYTLNVWKDMPETDEESGKITYKDYCFLKLGKEKLSYDPLEREVTIDGITYRML
ncbi:MAG: hypothetical protein J1F60_02535 [Oscillospiraceae bacterium]|nr:hypothetical protein [Oscillospiraceae bacterium]